MRPDGTFTIHVVFPGADETIEKLERLRGLMREVKELRDELGFVPDDPTEAWETTRFCPRPGERSD